MVVRSGGGVCRRSNSGRAEDEELFHSCPTVESIFFLIFFLSHNKAKFLSKGGALKTINRKDSEARKKTSGSNSRTKLSSLLTSTTQKILLYFN